MEFNFTLRRVGCFIALLVVFGFLGGFSNPAWIEPGAGNGGLTRPWLYTILLFGSGAVSATFIDHWAGLIDRTNIRWLYGVLGVLAMGSALIWQHVLRTSAEIS